MKIFYLPDLGEGLAEAEIREWYVKVGDTVTVDQPLVSMETAKAVVDVPSPYAGKITELHGNVNDIIKTGAPFIVYETGETITNNKTLNNNVDKGSVVGKLETSEKKWDDSDVIIGKAVAKSTAIKAMPAARLLAKEMQIDLSQVTPTGPQGMITVADVKKCFATVTSSTAVPLGENAEVLHGVRRVMAQIMAQSHREVVPATIIDDVDITDFPSSADMSVCILKAIVAAAKAEPSLNAWFDGANLERKVFTDVNIGIAVDSPQGLFVPVIKNAGQYSNTELRTKINDYKEAVRNRSIPAADLHGATITLSNFGTIAGRYATPVIVPPSVAILGCGRSRDVALVREGKVVIGRSLPLSLTFDHRAVTGGEASRFLAAFIASLRAIISA